MSIIERAGKLFSRRLANGRLAGKSGNFALKRPLGSHLNRAAQRRVKIVVEIVGKESIIIERGRLAGCRLITVYRFAVAGMIMHSVGKCIGCCTLDCEQQ